jgi:catechol 2,3-dioxygenase-like lactoylglutathione lyase family enzyme
MKGNMSTVQHIAFNCTDLKRQEQFYTSHFGFRRSHVFSAGMGLRIMQFRADTIGGTTIMVTFKDHPPE